MSKSDEELVNHLISESMDGMEFDNRANIKTAKEAVLARMTGAVLSYGTRHIRNALT